MVRTIIGFILGVIVTILFQNWFSVESIATQKNTDNDVHESILKTRPEVGISGSVDYINNTFLLTIENEGDSEIYGQNPSNDITTSITLTDDNNSKEIFLSDKIDTSGSSEMNISLDKFSGKTKLEIKCTYVGHKRLTGGEVPPCDVRGSNEYLDIEAPDFSELNLLGLDATSIDDTIDLRNIKDFFQSQKSNLKVVQIAGIEENSNVITINSRNLYRDGKRRFFIFFNDKKFNLEDSKVQFVKNKIASHFPHLSDVELYTFTDFLSPGDPNQSNVNWIKTYIGDCNNLEIHPNGCGADNRIFNKRMITEDLDFFFLVARTMDTK